MNLLKCKSKIVIELILQQIGGGGGGGGGGGAGGGGNRNLFYQEAEDSLDAWYTSMSWALYDKDDNPSRYLGKFPDKLYTSLDIWNRKNSLTMLKKKKRSLEKKKFEEREICHQVVVLYLNKPFLIWLILCNE